MRDLILVMENGDIVEQGTHDALLAGGGLAGVSFKIFVYNYHGGNGMKQDVVTKETMLGEKGRQVQVYGGPFYAS
ncbi:MAG: hypothetical protein FWB78_09855 [Treponema sp.]|nr:hypothetical protein [Treponema sp.]